MLHKDGNFPALCTTSAPTSAGLFLVCEGISHPCAGGMMVPAEEAAEDMQQEALGRRVRRQLTQHPHAASRGVFIRQS